VRTRTGQRQRQVKRVASRSKIKKLRWCGYT
jgi:hypothetical protein